MGVLVFGDREFVERFLGGEFPLPVTGTAYDAVTAMQALRDTADRNVVVGFPGREGVEFALRAAELHRDKRFYLAPTLKPTADLWSRAAELGVRLVSREDAPQVVARTIQGGRMQARLPAPGEVVAAEEERYRREVLEGAKALLHRRAVFFSLMGGTGKSTLSAAVACCAASWAAREKMDYRVVVVGATRNRFQSIFEALRVPDTVPQSIENFRSIDGVPGWDALQAQLVRPDPQRLPGLYFLPPPALAPSGLPADLVMRVLSILDHYFHLVVVDVEPSLEHDATLVALQTSPVVLLLVRAAVSDIRVVRSRFLPLVPRLRINVKSLRLVVTRVHPGEEKKFSPGNVAEALGGSIAPFPLVIPEDSEVRRNASDPSQPPVVLAAPDCPFSRAVRRLASDIVGVEMEDRQGVRRSFNPLRFIFRRKG